MVHLIKEGQRNLESIEVPGATAVRVADCFVGKEKNLAAGFTEYGAPSRLQWTFDYDEVFFMLEGSLEIHVEGREPLVFDAGDLGYVEKGTDTTIVVPQRAYFLHMTQPAWR